MSLSLESISGAFGARTPVGGAGAMSERQRSFAGLLAQEGVGATAAPVRSAERAREAASQLVAITFVQPILAQIRASDGAAEPFKATPAEKQFGALLDAELAQRVTQAARFPLVDRVARDLLRQSEAIEHTGTIGATA